MFIVSLIELNTDEHGDPSGIVYTWPVLPLTAVLLRAQLGPAPVEQLVGPEHIAASAELGTTMPTILNTP